jgi:hypothetical protein
MWCALIWLSAEKTDGTVGGSGEELRGTFLRAAGSMKTLAFLVAGILFDTLGWFQLDAKLGVDSHTRVALLKIAHEIGIQSVTTIGTSGEEVRCVTITQSGAGEAASDTDATVMRRIIGRMKGRPVVEKIIESTEQ